MYLDDVRDAAIPRDGSAGATDHRILFRYLYEYRAGTQDSGGWLIFHAQGLHQGCCLCIGRFYLHCMYNTHKRMPSIELYFIVKYDCNNDIYICIYIMCTYRYR